MSRTPVLLEDAMAAIIDYRGKTPRKTAAGVPLITAKVVKGGRIETPDEFVAVDEYDDWMRRGLPQAGDVVVTTEAPLGEVAQLSTSRVALAQRLILLRGKPGVLENDYLKYLMMSRDIQTQLRGRASGTTVVGIKQSELRKVTLLLPTADEQQQVAGVLGSLDDKIEHNRKASRALEALARAMFKAWFVDFKPVHAKAAGATSFPGMPPEAFAALPTRFTTSGLGPMPEGWAVGPLAGGASLARQQIDPQEHPSEHFEHFSIPAFDAGGSPAIELGGAIKSQKFIVSPDCVLFSKLNPRIPRVWLPSDTTSHRRIASTEFLVLQPRDGWSRWHLYCQLQQAEFRDGLAQSASGTSNSHQRIRPDDLLASAIVQPPPPQRDAFAATADPIFRLVDSLLAESRKLAELRDYLLPKLLTGTVRVKERANG